VAWVDAPERLHRSAGLSARSNKVAVGRSAGEASSIPKDERLTAAEADEGVLPKEPMLPGERVLVAGAMELKRVVMDLASRPPE
jgi:hypothetical protein